MGTGRLIVVDGTDGSGKATQVALLAERLRNEGHAVETITFPRYGENHFGELIKECLAGKRGDFMALDARIASTLYAADRFESNELIESWLSAGAIVLADRYASSNQIHQGGKIADSDERREFLAWLDRMEYGVFKIPRPDLIVFLDVPVEYSMRMLAQKETRDTKTYLTDGEIDSAEVDRDHQTQALKSARALVAEQTNWKTVRCVQNEVLRSKEEIHEDVYTASKDML